MIQEIIFNLRTHINPEWIKELERVAQQAEAGEQLANALTPFAEGYIDVSETAVILGYPQTHEALKRATAALTAWKEAQ